LTFEFILSVNQSGNTQIQRAYFSGNMTLPNGKLLGIVSLEYF